MNPASRIAPQALTQLPKPGESPAYLAFVRRQPCSVTGQTWQVEAAHTGPRGLSQRANDLDTIPLTRELHQFGPESYHVLGRVRFERHHGISIPAIIEQLHIRALACGIDLEPVRRKPIQRAGRIWNRRRTR